MAINIALLGGGYSGEEEVSLRSMKTIYDQLKDSDYNIFPLLINNEGWFYIPDNGEKSNIDKNDFSIIHNGEKITFDLVFNIIHGSPGEDGKLQGYFDMLNIPHTSGDIANMALTFNKFYCNQVVKNAGVIHIANSVFLNKDKTYSLGSVMENLELPVFVKPNEGGSSLGISKVNKAEELLPAIERAFEEDPVIIIEEFIEGRELTMGFYQKDGQVMDLPSTEIITKNEFFDFEAKYTAGVTDEITPADISEELNDELAKKGKKIYDLLNCKGLVRIDFIYNESLEKLYFLEVNTVPGQSAASLVPQQVRAKGMDLKAFYLDLITEALK